MKLAMKKTSSRQLITFKAVHKRQPTIRAKMCGEFSIAPWEAPEELRCDVLLC